jgi:hypothetical protein
VLTYENTVGFLKGEDSPVSLRNFSSPEDGFVWSHGKWCEIVFTFKETGRTSDGMADLMLDLEAFHKPETLPQQSVFVYVNGLRVASSYVSRRMILLAPFERKLLRTGENVIAIDTPDVVPPKEHGVDDSRLLGIKLFTLQMRKAG